MKHSGNHPETRITLAGTILFLSLFLAAGAWAQGPVGSWPMEGNVNDVSGNLLNGTPLPAGAPPTYVTGIEGVQALYVNGSQYARVPDDPLLDFTTGLTLATWVRPGRVATQDLIKKAVQSSTNGYELALSTSTSTWPTKAFVRFNQATSGDTYRVNSTTVYAINTWMHVAATYDGSMIRLYINGVLEDSLATTVEVATNALSLGIGAQVDAGGAASRFFQGNLDDSRVYGRALSASEVRELASHTLTINAANGTVARNPDLELYPHTTQVMLTATPDMGYDFIGWSGDASGSTNPLTVTMNANRTITAVFAPSQYTLDVTVVGNGTVTKTPDQATYAYGTNVDLAAIADTGWHFVGWTGDLTGATTPQTLLMDGNKAVTATFEVDTYILDLTVVGNGTVIKDPDQASYAPGTIVELTASEDIGWVFTGWSGDASGTANPTTVAMNGNRAVTATFERSAFTITATAGTGGSISPIGDVTVEYGANQSFAIAPDPGYAIETVLVDGGPVGAVATYEFTNVTADHNISASFLPAGTVSVGTVPGPITLGNPTVTVPVEITRSTGTPAVMAFSVVFSVSTPLSLPDDEDSITLPLDQGFLNADGGRTVQLLTIDLGNGVYQADGTTLGAPCGSSALSGTLFNIALSSSAPGGVGAIAIDSVILRNCSNGSILPDVGAGAMVTVDRTAPSVEVTVPNGGENWYVGETRAISWNTSDPEGVASVDLAYSTDGGSSYIPIAVVSGSPLPASYDWVVPGPGAVSALVRAIAQDANGNTASDASDASFTIHSTFTILAGVLGGNGSIDPSGAIPVAYGGTQIFNMVPDLGYHVLDVVVDGSSRGPLSSYTFENVTNNHTIEVTFAINTYTLGVTVVGNGTVTKVPDQGTYVYGTDVELSATGATGWHFVGWTGDLTGTVTPQTLTMDGNKAVTATFEQDQYTLNVTVVGNGTVTKVPDQGTYVYGTDVELSATAATGWHFVGWTGDLTGTVTPQTLTMDGNKAVTATFEQDQYTLDVTVVGNGTVTKIPDQGTYVYGTDVELSATAATGWHFVGWTGDLTGTVTLQTLTMDGNKAVTATFEANPAVPAVTNLTATQVLPGVLDEVTTPILLTWDAVLPGLTVEVWRATFGHYPEYDDAGGQVPTASAVYPPGPGWELTDVAASGGSELTTVRDFYYYVAYAQDGYGTWSPASNVTGGTLNYHLGDVSNGSPPPYVGNNQVHTEDISLLGSHYGISGSEVDEFNYLDVGPTTNMYVDGRPTTDNKVDFEDFVMYAINFGLGFVQSGSLAWMPEGGGFDELLLEVPGWAESGSVIEVPLKMRGSGTLIALSTRLSWDPAVVEPMAHSAGDWLSQQGGVVFAAAPGALDAAVMQGRGMAGEGILATVTFRVLASGDPRIQVASVDGRDARNRKINVEGTVVVPAIPITPIVTRLAPGYPNPFHQAVTIAFSLERRSAVELEVFAVNGRKVCTLARDVREPGEYTIGWDGRDDHGTAMPPGVYFVQLVTEQGRFARKVTSLR